MTDELHDLTIGNAARIIEKFGGIRPMATKMGVPVTTVQGWKQRNAIPLSRREDIVQAAKENGVDLEDLLESSPPLPPPAAGLFPRMEPPPGRPRREVFETALPEKSFSRPLFYGGILMIAGAIIGTVAALAPMVRDNGEKDKQIQELLVQLKQQQMKEAPSPSSGLIPDSVKKSLTDLEGKVEGLSKKAEAVSTIVDDLKTGTVEQRIVKLERHVDEFLGEQNAFALSGMLNRVGLLQQSPQGSAMLDGVVTTLLNGIAPTPTETKKRPKTLEENLAALRQSHPEVAETFRGVAPEDMKAAVALMGLAQLRQSLARDRKSFAGDLDLLKHTLAKDDPELQAAIDRLAPQAEKGVLTPEGLSKEFRSLAGDIVAASLKGEEIKFEDKLKARLNDLMVVEKGGQQISGTATQQSVAAAQRRLDQGDISGAIEILQTLEGPAAETAEPFVAEAQTTLLAAQLQQMLGNSALGNLLPKINSTGARMALPQGQGLNALIGQVKGMMPVMPGTMIHDPGSGISVYVPAPTMEPPKNYYKSLDMKQ